MPTERRSCEGCRWFMPEGGGFFPGCRGYERERLYEEESWTIEDYFRWASEKPSPHETSDGCWTPPAEDEGGE